MTTVSNAILALHEVAMRAKYLAETQCDSRLFHLRQITSYTARLTEGMQVSDISTRSASIAMGIPLNAGTPSINAGGPVFSTTRAQVCHLTQEQAARAAGAIMGRRA